MKQIRRSTAKTRKGIVSWLMKFNPFMPCQYLYDSDEIIAVHINRYTGAIVTYETATRMIPAIEMLQSWAIAA